MDSVQAEDNLFPKYFRPGYISEGEEKTSHTLADYAFTFYPDIERMPKHWHYRSHEYFMKKHGHLGERVWSLTKSYHLYILNGQRVARFWTDTGVCRVDLAPGIAAALSKRGIKTNHQSRAPFEHRMIATSKEDIEAVMRSFKEIYGI